MVNKKALSFALFLLLVSLWLTVSIIINVAGGGYSPVGFGGYFLYNTFYHLAFYVPLYLVFCSFFLIRKNFNKNDIIILILTLFPFFTSGLTLRIFLNAGNTPLEIFIIDSFGPLSPLLLLLLIGIEIILIIHASIFLKKHPQALERSSFEQEKINDKEEYTVEAPEIKLPEINNDYLPEAVNNMESGQEKEQENPPEKNVRSIADTLSEQEFLNIEKEKPVPERDEYKPLNLSTVSSLSGRKNKVEDETVDSYYNSNDVQDTENTEDVIPLYPENNISSLNGYADSIDNESLDREEAEVDGVDYSEPAYFRQQNKSFSDDEVDMNQNIEDDLDFSNPEISDNKYTDNSGYYSSVETSSIRDAEDPDSIMDDFNGISFDIESDTELNEQELSIKEYEEADIDTSGNLEQPEQYIDEDFKDIQGRQNKASSLDNYDPVTQYNDQIKTDDKDFYDISSDALSEETAYVEEFDNPSDEFDISPEIKTSSPGIPFSDTQLPNNADDEFEDDEPDDDEPVPIDNTAVVKQYFDSARFIRPPKKPGKYEIPVEDVLDFYQEEPYDIIDVRTREEAEVLKKTLAEFKIEAEVTGIRKGPVITMFEILPAPGVKLSRITNLADNIALRLAASRVRIVAPIPGKHAVGIEVPNRKRAIVSFRELIEVDYNQYKKDDLPVVLGKDITGEEQIVDLTKTPHLLIAGATGSGKSVCVNSIITSILYKRAPRDVKMILIDPKIVELKLYNGIPHLLTPVITDSKKAFQALQYCVFEMEKRYTLLDALSCRDIKSFNRKIKSEKIATMPLPYIVVVVDEFADLMATTGKELESTLARLAAMSRAVGIHLVLATQRPSIDVITGLIKANIPSRIAFMVASKTDSRIIIDSMGAEMLLGKGDMLFTSAWNPYPVRIQGAFLSENEVERVVEQVKEYGEPEYIDDEIFIDDDEDDYTSFEEETINDPLMERALEIVTTAGKASASYLQRRLKIGYNRAARLVEEMERKGIVGPQNGSKPRDLLHIPDNYKE